MTFRDDAYAAVDWAADYLDRLRELPVLSRVSPGDVRAALPASAPEQPEPFSSVLEDLDRVLMPGMTHWQSPRFFAYFATTGSEPGILAELLAATLNQVGILWRTSPALAELEVHMLDWIAQLLGLPAGWHGHIEDTASTSTLAAMIAAREATGGKVVVCSEHAHSSVAKAARMLGLESRAIPADDAFRLRVDALDLTDACAVVATVGTTATTSVDPVAAIAERCREAGAWLHVDAAYAGSAWVCPELRWSQDGVALADSLVVNAHKWLFSPMDCSLLWTSRPEAFRDAFTMVPEYLRTSDLDPLNLSEYAPALGRRFRALKLWATLRCYGRSGLQERIRRAVQLAEQFETWVRDEPGWELCAPRPFSVVCFRREGRDEPNERLLEAVNRTGDVFISHAKLDGRYVLRLAVGNERTDEADVRLAWDVLRREAAALES